MRAGVLGAHETLSDQHGVGTALRDAPEIVLASDAAHEHRDSVGRDARKAVVRSLDIDLEGP